MWRIAALNEAGGWKDRTTVEDMDLAVRASLKGWKFLYLGGVKVFNYYKKFSHKLIWTKSLQSIMRYDNVPPRNGLED